MTTNRLNILYIVLLSFVCLMFVPQASAQTLGDQFEEKFDKAWEATLPKVSESQINKTKEVLGDTVGGVVAGVASYGSGVTYDQPKSETERSKKMVDKYNLDTENGKIEITGKTGVSDYIGRSLKESGKAIADDWEQGNYLSAAAQASMAGAKAAWEGLKGLFKSGREIGTYTDPSTGKIYEFEIKKDGTMVATSGITEGCTPFPMKMAESKSCLFCPLFLVIYNACNAMATKSFAILGVPVANIMLIGFALYIAFIVLAHVSAFTKQDAPKFLTGLLGQSFKVLIAYLLLTNADQIYYYFISPVLKTGMQLGSAFLFQTSVDLSQCAAQAAVPDDGLMPSSLYIQLDCYIRSVQAEIAYAQAMGSTLMCIARNAGASWGGLLWDFSMMFQGAFIYLFSLLLVLAFSFYLIDATVTIGLVGALLPLLIAAWPFKKTASYTGKGFNMLMNTFFVYVFMGIVVSVNVQLIGYALTANSGGGMDGIEAILNEGKVEQLQEILDFSGGAFLILICSCIFGFKFIAQASSLAGTMSSGGISGIGNKIGGMAASGTLNIAKKASKPFTDPIKKDLKEKAGAAVEKVRAGVGKKLGIGKYGKAHTASADKLTNKPSAPDGANPSPSGGKPNQPHSDQHPTPDNTPIKEKQNGENYQEAYQRLLATAEEMRNKALKATQDNAAAWSAYTKSEENLRKAEERITALQQGFQKAEAEGDIEKMNAYGEAMTQAEQQHAYAQQKFQQSEGQVQQTEDKMNAAAIDAHVARLKADAMREGRSFNESSARGEAEKQIGKILDQYNKLAGAGRRGTNK